MSHDGSGMLHSLDATALAVANLCQVGLDTVENIEAHYVQERHLDRSHLDWLHDKYIVPGKLGKKSANGGLYDKPEVGSQTVLYFLNLGVGEKLSSTDPASIMHQGQILSLNVQEGGKPTELVSKMCVSEEAWTTVC